MVSPVKIVNHISSEASCVDAFQFSSEGCPC